MEHFNLIVSILLIHFLAVASPGPDFVMVVKNALTYSRKTGIYTALGIGSGIIVHVVYTFLGVGLLIKEIPALFNLIKYVGGIYIIYMGVMSIRSSADNKVVKGEKKEDISKFKAYRIGFLTNALNPKASLFFLSLFTLMIKPGTNPYVLILLGVLIVLQTTTWFIIISYFFTQEKIQKRYFQYEKVINVVFGIILILLAVKVIFFS